MIDDTIARKVNSSDASHFAEICGCFPSRVGCIAKRELELTNWLTTMFFCNWIRQVWGVIWLIVVSKYDPGFHARELLPLLPQFHCHVAQQSLSQALAFMAGGILVGLVYFKVSAERHMFLHAG